MKIFYIPALLGKVLWPMNTQHFAKSIIIGLDRDDYAKISGPTLLEKFWRITVYVTYDAIAKLNVT